MPRGRGTYSDEPNDKARESDRSDRDRSDHHDVAPDEQSIGLAQEPPD